MLHQLQKYLMGAGKKKKKKKSLPAETIDHIGRPASSLKIEAEFPLQGTLEESSTLVLRVLKIQAISGDLCSVSCFPAPKQRLWGEEWKAGLRLQEVESNC